MPRLACRRSTSCCEARETGHPHQQPDRAVLRPVPGADRGHHRQRRQEHDDQSDRRDVPGRAGATCSSAATSGGRCSGKLHKMSDRELGGAGAVELSARAAAGQPARGGRHQRHAQSSGPPSVDGGLLGGQGPDPGPPGADRLGGAQRRRRVEPALPSERAHAALQPRGQRRGRVPGRRAADAAGRAAAATPARSRCAVGTTWRTCWRRAPRRTRRRSRARRCWRRIARLPGRAASTAVGRRVAMA